MQWSSTKPGSSAPAQTDRSFKLFENIDEVCATLAAATGIHTHLAFYRWLQCDIARFLPHRTLLAAWGDCAHGRLSYDVTSTVPGLCTTRLADVPGLSEFVCMLHGAMTETNSRHFLSRNVLETLEAIQLRSIAPDFLEDVQRSVSALLAYRMHDERAECDAIYLFAITDPQWEPDLTVLDLIMPHIDTALRRVRCLKNQPGSGGPAENSRHGLSGREREVMRWVSEGKSNEEIGAILGISHNTVKNHLKRIFGKLGVSARSQAVCVFMQGAVGES